jgi:hypothetical protein
MILALASRDYSVSVWVWHEELQHTFLFPNIFQGKQACDLAWDPKGRYLYAVGESGLTAIVFPENSWEGDILRRKGVKNILSTGTGMETFPEPPPLFSFEEIKRGRVETNLIVHVPKSVDNPVIGGSTKKKRLQPTLFSTPAQTLPAPALPPPPEEPAAPELPLRKIRHVPHLKHKPHIMAMKRHAKKAQRRKRDLKIERSLSSKRRKIVALNDKGAEEEQEQRVYNEDDADEMQIDEELANDQIGEEAPQLDDLTARFLPALPVSADDTFVGENADGEAVEVKIEAADDGTIELRASRFNLILFRDFLSANPVSVIVAGSFIAVVTVDNRLVVYSPQGRKLSSPVLLESPLALVSSNEDKLLLIDVVGQASLLSCSPSLKLVWRSSIRGIFNALGTGPVPCMCFSHQICIHFLTVFVCGTVNPSVTPTGKVLLDLESQHVLSFSEDVCYAVYRGLNESNIEFSSRPIRGCFSVMRSPDYFINLTLTRTLST